MRPDQGGFSRFIVIFAILAVCTVALAFPAVRESGAGTFLLFLAIALSAVGIIISLDWYTRQNRIREAAAKLRADENDRTPPQDLEKLLTRTGQQLSDTVRTLEEERRGQRNFLEVLSDGVAAIDDHGLIRFCNSSFRRIFNVPEGRECVGASLMEVVRQPGVVNIYNKTQQSGLKQSGELQIDPAENRFMQVTATPMDEKSREPRTLLVLHDISRQKMVERMRVDFVANVSHEIRTPLTAINGFVETLLDGAMQDPNTAENFLKTIYKHTQRLNRLVEDILALSNIEMGEDKLRPAPMDPHLFIKTVEQTFQNNAAKKNVTILEETDADLPPLTADRDRLMQVMVNLVDNALKHTPEQGRITIACHRLEITPETKETLNYHPLDGRPPFPAGDGWQKPFLEFSITDTGEGIPDNAIDRLMERFYRVDKARSREMGGTGLGLAIVKHIIKAHHGSVKIESRLGEGTSVSFILPLDAGLPSPADE